MCGILYAKLKNSDPNFFNHFKNALSLMSYRGPDAKGQIQYDNNYFGHTRLSILDLTERSNQPTITDKNIILFKGEIYNYKQLEPAAPSDTLALAAMVDRDVDLTDKLCGMYVILTYNKNNQNLSILRDFYGEKPLYFYIDEQVFLASSTIKSIIYILKNALKIELKLNSLSLYEYLLFGYVREPKSIYDGIQMLSPGHALNFNGQDWKVKITNQFDRILNNTPFKAQEHTTHCLQTCDVLPGLLLSSGVDSTYLLSAINFARDDYKILTYQAENPNDDESEQALANLNKIRNKNNITTTVIRNHMDIHDLYEKYPAILEQPTSDGMNLFNLLTLGRSYDDQLKLIIVGIGGDELYGGYNSFKNYRKISLFSKYFYLRQFFPKRYQRFFMRLSRHHSVEAYYFLYRICPHFLDHVPKEITDQLFVGFISEMQKFTTDTVDHPYQKIKLCESFDYMRNQLLRDADNISLYCGFEARNPLLAVAAYNHQPDYKKTMKKSLLRKHGITFGSKRGFTLCDHNDKTIQFLSKKIRDYNDQYAIFPDKFINRLNDVPFSNFYLIRKIYILLKWLKYNNITNTQLQGFNMR